MDFLVRLVGSSWITTSIVNGLPIANYTSWALDVATTILKSTIAKTNPRYKPVNRFDRARIDALIWIHYDLKSEVLDRAKLNWMLSTQFDCLTRNDPEYINLVLSAFDHYTKDPRHPGTPGPQIFSKKTIPIPPNPKPQKPKATRKRKTN
jgi:hypothetical protein